jgi:hypothetical protein
MPDLFWGDIVPLLELAVVLNGGYFTFRHATIPSQTRHEETIQYLRKLIAENPIVSKCAELNAKTIILSHRYADFKEETERSHVYLDAFLLYAGYSICIFYSLLLYVAIIIHESKLSYGVAGALFLVGYSPVFVSLALELYGFTRSLWLFRIAVGLLNKINDLVRNRQVEKSSAAR